MLRILISTIVLGILSLSFAACESTTLANQDQFNQSQDQPDMTGISQGDPGYSNTKSAGSGTASER